MKTVIDAVNELKGEVSNSWGFNAKSDKFLFWDLSWVYYICGYSIHDYTDVDYICTVDEFNDLVSQMETNFGECVQSYSDYNIAWTHTPTLTKSTKELDAMDIDWNKTGCEFALVNNNKVIVEFFERKPSTSNCEECWMVSTSETLYLKNAWVLIERPQPKSLFTQAMADNGELPSVGMECMVLNTNCAHPKYIKGLIKYVGDLVIYAYVENGERCDNVKTLKFKPLTPPMTLIDGKAYQFDVKNGIPVSIGLYSKNLHRFILEGSQYDIVKCTNIQPLTAGKE